MSVFMYAGVASGFPANGTCLAHVVYDAGGVTGLTPHIEINGTDLPGVILNEPRTAGYLNVNGLYYVGNATVLAGTNTYEVHAPDHTSLGAVSVVFDSPGGGCPTFPATPHPVLSATPLYNPTPGVNDVRLDWTASVSQDTHFWSIEYDVERDSGSGWVALDYLHDTLTYLDVSVPTGVTYVWRVRGQEPVIGHGDYSNTVTITAMPEVGPTAVTRAAWGVLAR